MANEFLWENNEKTIARIIFNPGWSLDDADAVGILFREEAIHLDHPVYVIADFTGGVTFPSNVLSRRDKITTFLPDNLMMIVIVGTTPVLKATFHMLQRFIAMLSPRSAKRPDLMFANNLDEAHQLIKQTMTVTASVSR